MAVRNLYARVIYLYFLWAPQTGKREYGKGSPQSSGDKKLRTPANPKKEWIPGFIV